MYETIKKFLAEGGKCLLIENGEPVGVVLTMEEYRLLSQTPIQSPPYQGGEKEGVKRDKDGVATHPIGEAMVKEMDFPSASADIDEINLADSGDVTLEDLGLDELL